MGIDQPTFQDYSLTMVTKRGSHEVDDLTSVSWQPSGLTKTQNAGASLSTVVNDSERAAISPPPPGLTNKHLPVPQKQSVHSRQTKSSELPTSRGAGIVMGTSVIMNKFLHSFKVPATPPSEPPRSPTRLVTEEDSSLLRTSGCQLKSHAEGVHDDPGCGVDDSFISVTPLDCANGALDVSSASKASSYATCINCEKTAIE